MARWIVLAGVTALLVLGYLATQYPSDGPGRRNVRFVETELQQKADLALADLGANQWAIVTVDGQIATLSGEAPTEADRQDALDAVRKAEWTGGALIGGITKVVNATTLAAAKTPYEWAATLSTSGRVRLTGYVPGQRARAAIIAEAKRLFPGGMEDQMIIACCNPAGDWNGTAIWSLAQLSRLTLGEVRFSDKHLLIKGAAPNAAVKSEIESAARKVGKGFKASTDISLVAALELTAPDAADDVPPAPVAQPPVTLPPAASPPLTQPPATPPAVTAPPVTTPAIAPPPPVTEAPVTETPVPATPVPSAAAADCQRMVDKFMASNTIAFASGSANIRSVATPILNRLVQIGSQCAALRIRVTGHTDKSATEAANPNLSRQRAEAIATYLAAKGIARDRISTRGFAAEQPVSEGASPEAQAKNRRIEITITTN